MAAFQDDVVLAEHALVEAIQIGRELGSSLILCFALGVFSQYVALPRGDIITARTYAEESSRYAREIGMSWAEAQGEVMVMTRISSIFGNWDEARQYAQKAAAIFQNLRDPGTLTIAYNELAGIELHTGNLAEARRYLKECIITGKEINLRTIVAQALESYAYIAQAQNLPLDSWKPLLEWLERRSGPLLPDVPEAAPGPQAVDAAAGPAAAGATGRPY